MKEPYVYILANKPRGTLYVGVTGNILQRMTQHASTENSGFTAKYKVHRLVYAESAPTMESAIAREKQLKSWKRRWKIELIEKNNPEWKDLLNFNN
jgi:putative endonuclease